MKFYHLLVFAGLLAFMSCDSGPKKAKITTSYGDITIMLYDSTPKHRDNFVKLVNEGFYDSLLFHRVIDGFMIQGGDPRSKGAAAGQSLGSGGPGYKVDAEIGAPHIRGAIAAARDNNPEKQSSGSQFYIVDGKPVRDQEISSSEQRNGFTYNDVQKELYKSEGGSIMLDGNYTVFGEVLEGMEVVDKIAEVEKDRRDRPAQDVLMTIKMLN